MYAFANCSHMLTPVQSDESDTLARLSRAVQTANEADHAVSELVSQARTEGATWRTIADALGTTASNAHRKYHEL